jgi:hypothetical protein
MRVSEILAIRDASVVSEKGPDGQPHLKVKSTLFKGIPEPQGRKETWVIVPPVANALKTIAAATIWYRSSPGDVIFRNSMGQPLKTGVINKYINLFRDHVTTLFPSYPFLPERTVPHGRSTPGSFVARWPAISHVSHLGSLPACCSTSMFTLRRLRVCRQ